MNIDLMPLAKELPPSRMVEGSCSTKPRRLLVEYQKLEIIKDKLFEETSSDPNRKLIVKALLQRAGVRNQNGRLYTKEILMREAEKYDQEFVRQRRAIGELDHPEKSVVELKSASHIITAMEWQGNDLIGVIEVLRTPCGNILRQLIQDGVQVGISSRGMGSVRKEKTNEGVVDVINDDFSLLAFDVVSNPSVTNAQLESMNENTEPLDESVNVVNTPIISTEDAYKIYQRDYDYLLKRLIKSEDEIRKEFGFNT